MLQPSEEKKGKYFQTLFFFLFMRGRLFYRWERGLSKTYTGTGTLIQ
jgi:hypothetical protein